MLTEMELLINQTNVQMLKVQKKMVVVHGQIKMVIKF